jgi:hypothetical protein
MKALWLIGLCLFSFQAFGQNQNLPSEDELLDFDSLDKAEQAADKKLPNVPAKPKAPAPPTQAKPEQPVAPPPPQAIAPPAQTPAPTPSEAEAPPPPPLPEEQVPEAVPPPPVETTAEPTPTQPSNNLVEAEGVSELDAKREARFARIYEKYNKSEITDDAWAQIAGDKASENYVMQQGDNLWDISTKFFGNGFYWPKVWQLNDTITNPHNVKVGNTVHFSPGSSTSPPRLAVEKHDDEPEVESLPTAQTEESAEPAWQTVVIPPGHKGKAVLKRIPPSFADWRGRSGENYDQNGFSTDILKRYDIGAQPKSAVSSLVVEQPWTPIGSVIEMEGGLTVASTYQHIIIKLKRAAQIGEKFTVFSDNGPVEDEISDMEVGSEMQTRAEIEVLELIEGTVDTYRALVKFTVLPVRIGDSLIPGQNITRVEYDLNGPKSTVAARIVNGEFGKRRVFSLHNIVFLNRGDKDGLQAGMLLPVIKNVQLRNADAQVKYDSKPIGTLKIVHTGSHVATAIIVAEYDSIIPGDETAMMASNSVETSSEPAAEEAPAGESPNTGTTEAPVPNTNEDDVVQ